MGLDIKKVDETTLDALAGAEFEVHKQANGEDAAIKFVKVSDPDGVNRYRVATQAEIDDPDTTKVTTIKVTDTDPNKGMLKIDGLNDTTYYLKETKAPTGYNLPSALVGVNVQPDASDYNSEGILDFKTERLLKQITNKTGIDLPVTGGIGTVLFTAIGLLLMACAAYFLFFSRKRNAK